MDFKELDKKLEQYKNAAKNNLTLQSLKDDFIIRWTHHSTSIEGNTISLEGTKLFLEEGLTSAGKTIKEHLELRNHRDAILYVEKILAEKISLSEEVIKNIHREVYKNIG
ncbi:MAG: Fic family protein, partial [Fusobacteriaceae bacterium]